MSWAGTYSYGRNLGGFCSGWRRGGFSLGVQDSEGYPARHRRIAGPPAGGVRPGDLPGPSPGSHPLRPRDRPYGPLPAADNPARGPVLGGAPGRRRQLCCQATHQCCAGRMVKLRVLLDRSSELVILRNGQGVVGRPNDKSSATRPTGRNDCNQTLRPGSLQRMVGHVAIIITLSLDMTNRSREPKCHPKRFFRGYSG